MHACVNVAFVTAGGRYLSYVQPTGRVWHKAFFRLIRAQGRSPNTLGGSKNTSIPAGITPLKERFELEGTVSWGLRMPVKVHLDWLPLEPGYTGPDPCSDQRNRPSVSQPSASQRVVHTLHSAWRKYLREWIGLVFMKEEEFIIV